MDIAAMFARWGKECFYCRTPLIYGAEGNGSIDHVIPYALGGRNALPNIVPACKTCNNHKADKMVYLHEARSHLVFRYPSSKPKLKGWF